MWVCDKTSYKCHYSIACRNKKITEIQLNLLYMYSFVLLYIINSIIFFSPLFEVGKGHGLNRTIKESIERLMMRFSGDMRDNRKCSCEGVVYPIISKEGIIYICYYYYCAKGFKDKLSKNDFHCTPWFCFGPFCSLWSRKKESEAQRIDA